MRIITGLLLKKTETQVSILRLMEMGVDGIITNRPDILMSVLGPG